MKLKSSHAHEEGGLREWNLSTTEFVGSERVEALRARRLDQNEELLFEADLVILALGFTGASTELQRAIPQLKFNPRGQIATSNQFQTGLEKLFACGDNRRGASLIVWAIAEGRQVARAVDQFLKIRHPI